MAAAASEVDAIAAGPASEAPAAAVTPAPEPPPRDGQRVTWATGTAPAGAGFAVSAGARRVALIVAWLVGAVVVAVGILGLIWPQGSYLLIGVEVPRLPNVFGSPQLWRELWPVLVAAWLAALVAVTVPRGPTRLRRWPACLAVTILGLVVAATVLWWTVDLIGSGVAAHVYGPRSHAAVEARTWLYCALGAAGIAMAACGVLVVAAVRQYGAAAERAEPTPERGGYSTRAAAVVTCAAIGAIVTVAVSWLREGLDPLGWTAFTMLYGTRSQALGAALALLVAAGWLVPAVVFGLKARRFPMAAWIAAGAAGAILISANLSSAAGDVRLYRYVAVQYQQMLAHPEALIAAARTQVAPLLLSAAIGLAFGVALLAAAVAQYRAWRAAAPRTGRAPWRAAGTVAAVLAAVAIVTPLVVSATVARERPLLPVPRVSPSASASSPPAGVAVTPAAVPGDGIPTVVGVVPDPSGISGWDGYELQVELMADDGETIDVSNADVWVDGDLRGSGYIVAQSVPESADLNFTLQTPIRGTAHTFHVRIDLVSGKRLECTWSW